MDRFVIISGCSGGGKSALLGELDRRGYATIEEPGRRIVEAALAAGRDDLLPWVDPAAFARRAIEIAGFDRAAAAGNDGWVFFDRSLVDAAAALDHVTGESQIEHLCREKPYGPIVFMTPPWPEIFVNDAARRHDLGEAVAEYDRLLAAYARLGYAIEILPKVSLAERADFVLRQLGA